MRQVMFAAALVLTGTAVSAQNPQPGAVPAVQPAVQPGGGGLPGQPNRPIAAAQMTKLEEEFELAEAARDVKRAYVKAAEVTVEATRTRFELITKTLGAVSEVERVAAKYEFEQAKAQLEIRAAELKESEVKVKYAKKRLDDAKAVGVRPAPGPVRPVPVDPVPQARATSGKAVQELKGQLVKLQTEIKKLAEETKPLEAAKKLAEERVELLRKQAALGTISRSDLDEAEADVKRFKERIEKLQAEEQKLKDQSDALETKLQEKGGN